MEEATFQHIMLYYFKKGKNAEKRFVQCMEKVPWLIERVRNGLWSFLLLLTFWPNNCCGADCCIGKCLAANTSQQQETAGILKISKSIKLLVKMKNVFFILWKKKSCIFWPTQYLAIRKEPPGKPKRECYIIKSKSLCKAGLWRWEVAWGSFAFSCKLSALHSSVSFLAINLLTWIGVESLLCVRF